MTLLDGKAVAKALFENLKTDIQQITQTPKVVFVRVGEDPASVVYVNAKSKRAKALGIDSVTHVLPEDSEQATLLERIDSINNDASVHGLLVQFPLPNHMNEQEVLWKISPDKDVDGLHPINVGRLWTGQEAPLPCTPAGLIQIMKHYDLPIQGQHVVIVGRSNLVGKPAAALFLRENATVTIAHSRTRDLAAVTKEADILVAAVGRRALITPEMVKEGAVVLDVGVTRGEGKKIHGDIHPDVAEVARYLTPMPGGTGPMTIAMLMQNTVWLAQRQSGV